MYVLRRFLVLATMVTVSACSSAATNETPGTPNPPATRTANLAWAPPSGTTLLYNTSDSSLISVQAGPANVDVTIIMNTKAELAFQGVGDSLHVTARFVDFNGAFRNSMGPSITLTKDDVTGSAVLTVSPRGEVGVVQHAPVSQKLAQAASVEALFRNLFARVPGRAVPVGTTWTDTVSAADAREGMSSNAKSIVTSTYSRDTTVAGQTLQVIDSKAVNTIEISGTMQDVKIVQKMSGNSTIQTLWNSNRKAVIERSEIGDASGTMDLPAMGMTGLALKAFTQRRYVLAPGT